MSQQQQQATPTFGTLEDLREHAASERVSFLDSVLAETHTVARLTHARPAGLSEESLAYEIHGLRTIAEKARAQRASIRAGDNATWYGWSPKADGIPQSVELHDRLMQLRDRIESKRWLAAREASEAQERAEFEARAKAMGCRTFCGLCGRTDRGPNGSYCETATVAEG